MIVRRSSAGRILHFPAQQPTPDSKCSPGGQLGIYSSGQMAVAEKIFRKYQIPISSWNFHVVFQLGIYSGQWRKKYLRNIKFQSHIIFQLEMYPCSTKTGEILGNPSPTAERFPETQEISQGRSLGKLREILREFPRLWVLLPPSKWGIDL